MKVAVVGAGPAGASTGHHLASAGHEVSLVDKCEFPRPKTCGDWVTRGALGELARLGFDPGGLRAKASAYAEVRHSVVGAPNGQTSAVTLGQGMRCCCIPRAVFDALLVDRAIDAGCRMRVQTVRDLRALQADHDLVVDARGVYAGQANTVALRAYWTVPTDAVDSHTASAVQIFTIEHVRMGYGWIFPVDVGPKTTRFNLGIGIWKAEHDGRGIKIRDALERFVEGNPVTRRLSRVALQRERGRGHHLALADGPRVVAEGGVLRVGDAANLTDPITGEGIANAVLGGRLVAEAIDEAARQGNGDGASVVARAEQGWQRRYDTQLLPELMAALRLRNLLVTTRRKNLAIWALRHRPQLAARFHGSLEGVVSYREVLPLPGW